jgi:hypothetical protein
MPGVSIGTRNIVSPRCLDTSGFVRVSRNTKCASCAIDVNTFSPLITQSSPSRTAVVCDAATSEPASGSL